MKNRTGQGMTSILAINGSYRKGGVTDQVVAAMSEALRAAGADVEIIFLREYPIDFCINCRECTLQPGNAPGVCVRKDGMQEIINKIEKSVPIK
jgi:multimeric flavodoxin WrbA